MNCKAKVVGLNFHPIRNKVVNGDYLKLVHEENEFDPYAIAVYNFEGEKVGFIANTDRTLSPENRKNGNLSALELHETFDFNKNTFYAEAERVYNSCIYLLIDEACSIET